MTGISVKYMQNKEPTRRGDTRERLIVAAERLFGEHGVHCVTLKQINEAAGQRNESALHYHFGSKTSLLEAIFEHRVKAIDERRVAYVEEMMRRGEEHDLRAIVTATFLPMAELLDTEEGVRFVRFLAQMLNDPEIDLPTIALRSEFAGIRQTASLLTAALGDLPPDIAVQRQRLLVEITVSSLAIWTRHHGAASDVTARALFLGNLFDSIVGFLTAPVSAETLNALKRATKKKDKK